MAGLHPISAPQDPWVLNGDMMLHGYFFESSQLSKVVQEGGVRRKGRGM